MDTVQDINKLGSKPKLDTPQKRELMEKLADIEHQRWADWQKYCHSKGVKTPDGDLLIGKEFVDRWEKQIWTSYNMLTEKEKDSDREQVMRYWNYINLKGLS